MLFAGVGSRYAPPLTNAASSLLAIGTCERIIIKLVPVPLLCNSHYLAQQIFVLVFPIAWKGSQVF